MSRPPSRAFAAKDPGICADLAEIRAGIDEVDELIVELLARRQAYAGRTPSFKTERSAVRDEVRIAKVIANVLAWGAENGVPPDIVEPIWRAMIEAVVAHEHGVFDAANPARAGAARPADGRGGES